MTGKESPRPFDRPPAQGRRRGPATLKGRQVEPAAAREIAALLGDRSRRRDLLIEFLHLIQDRWGSLSAAHLAALAAELRLALAEVYEVATFYHNFQVRKEDDPAPVAAGTWVCDSLTCALLGADALKAKLGTDARPVACLGRCDHAPAVLRPGDAVPAADDRLDAYRAAGGDRKSVV